MWQGVHAGLPDPELDEGCSPSRHWSTMLRAELRWRTVCWVFTVVCTNPTQLTNACASNASTAGAGLMRLAAIPCSPQTHRNDTIVNFGENLPEAAITGGFEAAARVQLPILPLGDLPWTGLMRYLQRVLTTVSCVGLPAGGRLPGHGL